MNQREIIDGLRLEQQTVYQNVNKREVKVKDIRNKDLLLGELTLVNYLL